MIYDEENFPELPMGWISIGVEDAVESVGNSNKKLKSKDALSQGRFPVIDQGQENISGYSDDESLVVDASELKPVILFGDHTRILKQISHPFVPGADGTKLFQAKEYWDTRFVYQMIRAIKLPDKGYARHYQYLRNSTLPLPPLSEQKRIADKLDTVLARVDACSERLNRVPLTLKRFKQSVLAAATSGKLTEDWRVENVHSMMIGGIESQASRKINNWKQVSLSQICESITDGDHQAPPQANNGIPFITIAAINDGQLRLEKASRYVPREYFEKLKSIRKPAKGDVLYSVTGSICIPALITEELEFTFQRHIAILKPNLNKINSKYLYFVLGSEAVRKQGFETATGTAQLTLALSSLRNLTIDLPPIDEQQEIVRRVETLFAFADRLEARLTGARNATERLTPAILAKAFRGELVDQDPNDEPAEFLLKRIQSNTLIKEKKVVARGKS